MKKGNKKKTPHRIILGLLLLTMILIRIDIIETEKFIDESAAMILVFITMLLVFYSYVHKPKNKKLTASEEEKIEEKGYTKEGAVGIVGLVVFIIGFFFGDEKPILMIFINILGLLIMGLAVYLQYKKPRNNKYVLRNVKYYFYSWIGVVIWFFLVIVILYFQNKSIVLVHD